ncbi:MAG: efflux RND transporter periplasmic adaptor subunit [Puniceicoccales bacterium]|jgi:multidrug efflux system membrane fusion protein|nr:efflux RND transporter periplasmic adaptor subunit [Puniceicoccales bacterium]
MRNLIIVFMLVVAIGAGAYGFHWRIQRNLRQDLEKKELREAAAKPVPVLLAKAARRDVPVWLEAPGWVRAYNSVTVRPRVSGTLDSVNFTEGRYVARGDVLAQIDPRPYRATLDQALSKQAQNAALLKNARLELARVKGLVAEDAESQRVLDDAEARVAELEARAKEDSATVAAAQLDLDFTTLRSPIDGRTGIRQLDAGNTVTANQPTGLVVVTQTQPISAVFDVPQRHLPLLRPVSKDSGSRPLAVEVFNDETGEVLSRGELSLLDNTVNRASDNLQLKATFKNEDDSLWPDQYIMARVHVRTIKGAVLVPEEAVQAGVDGSMVYVAKDGIVQPRPVTTGSNLAREGLVVIEKGLLEGEEVVREGQNRLRPGSKVSAVPAK